MALSAIDVVNQAVQLIGNNQPPVTGNAPNFDSSPNGQAAKFLYTPTVQAVGRSFGWDFSRNTVALALSGNTAPFPWSLEYLYPTNGVQVWQIMPPSLADPNNPLPLNWAVGNAIVGTSPAVQKKVIWTNQAGALAVFNNAPVEATWDPLFLEAVVRLLASKMAIATAGKPDTAEGLLQSGAAFETQGEARDS